MQKVNIVNCLITRRCNLACEYCQISGHIDQPLRPQSYPDSEYYFKNEKDSEWWIKTLSSYFAANKDVFFILYGGEPFIRWELLVDIVNFLNKINAKYTIISNCTEGVKKNIFKFFKKVEGVYGFTASIDPSANINVCYDREGCNDDEIYKSQVGYRMLLELMNLGLVKDPVAEITCDCDSIYKLEDLVKQLSKDGITSDITMIDIAKGNYYDFSNIYGQMALVPKDQDVRDIFNRLKNSNYLIHMKDKLLDMIYDCLPCNVDCEMEKGLSNVTIDSDGVNRLCLRIRGNHCVKYMADSLFNEDGTPSDSYNDIWESMCEDKKVICHKCMWSCVLMSKMNDCNGIINH